MKHFTRHDWGTPTKELIRWYDDLMEEYETWKTSQDGSDGAFYENEIVPIWDCMKHRALLGLCQRAILLEEPGLERIEIQTVYEQSDPDLYELLKRVFK